MTEAEKCPHCGKPTTTNDKFCQSCGTKLSQEKTKPKTEKGEEKKEKPDAWAFVACLISGVVSYFTYRWILSPVGEFFGISKTWIIIVTIIMFFAGAGFALSTHNREKFYELSNKKLRSEIADKASATSKIKKLKELKDTGAISEEEFETKKAQFLKEI